MDAAVESYKRKTIIARAAEYHAAIRKAWNDFESEKDAWYRHGDGRPSSRGGRGYAFPYCFHGASQWTDYDNICGGCEDGFTGYGSQLRFMEWAIGKAHQDYNEHRRRSEWFCSAPHELYKERGLYLQLIDWVMEPIKREVSY